MENVKVTSSGGGIGFCGLLTIVFIVLKLCNIIAWSWWWVLSPIWISIVLWILFLMFLAAFAAIFSINQY